jgi:aminoglycoside phosphotransferase (APT) family kinase protein
MPGPRERDLEATRERLAPWLRARLGADAVSLSELTGPSETGFSSDTLLFEASARTDGAVRRERLVARLEPQGFNVFPSYDVGVQYRVLRALEGSGVPLPRPRWLSEDASVLGTRFFVMDRVDGRVPGDSPPYHTAGWVAELAPAERARLWWNGIEVLCRIHRVDWCARGLDFLRDRERPGPPLAQQLQYYEEFFRWAVKEPERYPLLLRAQDWLRRNAPQREPVGLCWGDSRLSNLVFQGVECAAVLDWEMVRLGNPLQDVAWWIAIDRCLCEGVGAPRLAGLPEAGETLARWSGATGLPADDFAYYEILALMKFSVIIARIALQLQHYGVLPADSTFDVDNLASSVLARALPAAATPA